MVGKPFKLGRYQKLGIEGMFAMHAHMINFFATNICSFSGLALIWFLRSFGAIEAGTTDEALEALVSIKKENTFTVGLIQILEMVAFNVLGLYLIFLYFTLAYCNPGRIESAKEKQFINQRFGRLFTELQFSHSSQ